MGKKKRKRKVYPHRGGLSFQKTYGGLQQLEYTINARFSMLEQMSQQFAFRMAGIMATINIVPVFGRLVIKLIDKKTKQFENMMIMEAKQMQEKQKKLKEAKEKLIKKAEATPPPEGSKQAEDEATSRLSKVIKEEMKGTERLVKCAGCDEAGGTMIMREGKYWHEECYKVTKEEEEKNGSKGVS